MSDESIPDDLRNFILRHIDSVGQLEALLLLRGSPDERWEQARIAKRLYASEQETEEMLARLCEDGLLSCENGVYWYGSKTAEQQSMVDNLANYYSRHLISVTNLIHAKTRRIREFANAFRLRKDR